MLPIIEWVALAQTSGPQTGTRNPIADEYFVIALLAVIVGLIVLICIRANAKGSSKRHS